MLNQQEREALCVVLVRARNSSNIGAAARAMRDFGFRHLRVVNQFTPPFEAARSAVDASEIMTSAQIFPTVASAVADCTLAIGTTAVGERSLQHQLLELPAAAESIRAELAHAASPTPRVALVFGSEKTGLSNDELSHCHWLLTIPLHQVEGERHVSMNLGQAVAVCLYELSRSAQHTSPSPGSTATETPANGEALERITRLMSRVMEAAEYTRRHAANSDPDQVRRLVRRIGVSEIDAPIWMGILRQILWKLGVPSRGD
ncbi:MAG TPA: TrmH family RNA methyltransferase [Acidobacteriaceae bacterium]|nr:TrmH family RNA methyltransferase [Acidobacteriaceae bacterium]